MQQTRNQQRERASINPGGGDGSNADSDPTMVTVSHWPYCERLPVASLTVAQVRDRYRDRFDIDPHSQATLDGNEADGETVIEAGQVLMFVRRAGEKGATAACERR